MNAQPQVYPEAALNIEAEQALLGAIMVNNDALDVVMGTGLRDYHFSEGLHSEIYSAAGKQIDAQKIANPVTLKAYLPTGEMIGEKTMGQYLAAMASNAVSISGSVGFAQAILHAWARREMCATSQHLNLLAAQAKDDLELGESLQALQNRLLECQRILDGGEAEGVSMEDAASTSMQKTMDVASGKIVIGIDHGLAAVTQLIGPITAGQWVQVGGSAKHGKTSAALQICRGAAENGHPCFVYSGEMDAEELGMREKARDTGISVKQQKAGNLTSRELERLVEASRNIGPLPIQFQDRRRPLEKLCREIKTFVIHARRRALPLIVVDSVLLIDRDKFQLRTSDAEFASIVSDRMKALARDLKVPIIGIAQLKKNTFEKPYRNTTIDASYYRATLARSRPRASDLFGSIEKDADHVLLVFNASVVLRDMEPAENTPEHLAWEGVVEENRDKAEILLAVSRSADWPARRTVGWDGPRQHFGPRAQEQRALL